MSEVVLSDPLVVFSLSYHRHAEFQLANHFHWFDPHKIYFFLFPSVHDNEKLHLRQDGSSASEGNPEPPLNHVCLQSHPSDLFPLQLSLQPSSPGSPPSLGPVAGGLSSLLLKEGKDPTAWHIQKWRFMPLLFPLPLLAAYLSTRSDTHRHLPLWWFRRLPWVTGFLFNLISEIFLQMTRKPGDYFHHEEVKKTKSVKH